MSKPSLLLVDDDPLIQDLIGGWFEGEYAIVAAHHLAEVKSALRQMQSPPDCALVDLGLPPTPHRPDEGFAVIRLLQAAAPDCAIVVVSGQESRRHAQRARALGAGDYVEKPCAPEILRRKLLECRQWLQSARDNLGLVGESPPMQTLRAEIANIAAASFPVLIAGETGAGKELAARALHEQGRPGRPFAPVNCAAIPEHLAEPSLFGHAKGAFTGAAAASAGMLGDAEDGTLFLDEIGDLSPPTQGKLLRAIETGEYCRVGETRPRQCAARIVAATNRDLDGGGFRRDLYHRLSAYTLRMPPLREMGDDKALLLSHFRAGIAADMQSPPFSLSEEAEAKWLAYRFPGNIRELRNIVVRLQIKHGGKKLEADDIAAEFCPDDSSAAESPLDERAKWLAELIVQDDSGLLLAVAALQKNAARLALEKSKGDSEKAAALLSLSPDEWKKIIS